MRLKAAFVTAALAVAACATPEQSAENMTPSEGRDCFRAASVNGYEIIDDHNIRIRIGANRTYTMNTNWNAGDLDWTTAIVLRSDTGWVCTGRVLGQVEVSGGALGQTYPINTITRDPEPPADQQGS